MKKMILKSLLVGTLLSTSAFAYEASSVSVNWIGFKTQNKVGVPGTFNKVDFSISKNDDFAKFLTSANVTIDALSLDSKMKFRDNNIISTLFKLANVSQIKAKIVKVTGDDKMGSIDVEIDMNNTKKVIPMKYKVEDSVVKATGAIEILDFAMNESFAAFAAKCKAFHAGKTWSDTTVSFDIPFK